jgi:hypothetical protein
MKKIVEEIICDVHGKDHPATHFAVEVDMCDAAWQALQQKQTGLKPYQCEDCGREFTVKQALGKHRHDAHGVESGRERLARERAEREAQAVTG